MNIKQIYRFLSPKYQNLFLEYKVNFKPRFGNGLPPHSLLYEIINSNRKVYSDYLEKAMLFSSKIHEIKKSESETNPLNPTWNNSFLPGLDIIGIYTLISVNK